ncbi:acetate kinase [Pantanalinema sp. GBBB05]|uniref:acetate kinase n=1 Tax=Pantanalinema sp. GBBB05 TaxID=2604139 RepID=UPI001D410A59|nr:acetate kinase [Pantanalinema sp. GBBB05]
MKILVLNAGSSSQKACLYELPGGILPEYPLEPLWEGFLDFTHQANIAEAKVKTHTGVNQTLEIPITSRKAVTETLLQTLWQGEAQVIDQPTAIQAIGHRVVHGGEQYRDSICITPEVKAEIDRLSCFAPVHNPANLEGIEITEAVFGQAIPQVAVFDTAFHATLPAAAYTYPGQYDWLEQGIRRYGFHGTSHRYCAERAAALLNRDLTSLKLITCHLGNGASLAAVQQGISIETTMGFTPLEGLMMGSRSGSVDPGILLHLLRTNQHTPESLDTLLNKAAGMKGISGITNDLREIIAAAEQGHDRAQLALDMYIHRLRYYMGAMLAVLGGLDAIVFTAGVGENSALIRAAACEAFGFLGLKIDPEKNTHHEVDQDISTPDSQIRVLVIRTQEDWAIAKECWRLTHDRL